MHILDINDIEFRIIASPKSRTASAEVGVEARYHGLNIVVQCTGHKSQYQNKLAAIELIKKEIANKT